MQFKEGIFKGLNLASIIFKVTMHLNPLTGQWVLSEYISLINFKFSNQLWLTQSEKSILSRIFEKCHEYLYTKIARIKFLWSGHLLNIWSVLLCCIYEFLFFSLRSFTRWNKSSIFLLMEIKKCTPQQQNASI